jgi:hypothetical protein
MQGIIDKLEVRTLVGTWKAFRLFAFCLVTGQDQILQVN